MKASFKEVFGQESNQFAVFSPVVLEQLNRELPKGTQYYELKDGDICIGPCEGNVISIGGLEAVVTPDMREAIGDNPSKEEMFKYCYNAQEPLYMKLLHEGLIKVNGEFIPADRFVMNPNYQVNLEDGQFIAFPQPFPPPHELHLGVEGTDIDISLMVHRVPNKSADVHLFESSSTEPLEIKYSFNQCGKDIPELTFSMNVHSDRFRCLDEAVSILHVCSAAANGTLTVEGKRLGSIKEGDIESIASPELICWLEKALAVESYLGISFDLGNIIVDRGAMNVIADLYYSCVHAKPIKTPIVEAYIKLTNENEGAARRLLVERAGEKIALFYQTKRKYLLFGEEIPLISLHGVFDLIPERLEEDDDGSQLLFLEKQIAGPDGYSSHILFRDQSFYEGFCNERAESDIVQILAQAKTISNYLDEDM